MAEFFYEVAEGYNLCGLWLFKPVRRFYSLSFASGLLTVMHSKCVLFIYLAVL